MASALLAGRQVPLCLSSQRRSARPSAFRSRPAPFTPVRRVFVRAQEADDVTVSDEELAQLAADDDVVEVVEVEDGAVAGDDAEDDDMDAIYAAMAGGEEFELDAEEAALVAAVEADALNLGLDLLTAAAVDAELAEDAEDKEESAMVLEDVLAVKLAESANASEVAELLSTADVEGADEVDLDDFVPAMNSDRYEERPLSADDKVAIAPYKLSKNELRNLLPQDWDQINVDFFSNKKDENIPLPEFRLNVLWSDKNLAVAIDQVYSRGQVSPLTEYYFWPRQDAWEELRQNLEERTWISERDRIILLNRLTQLINFWQDEQVKHSIEEARGEFPDCAFTVA